MRTSSVWPYPIRTRTAFACCVTYSFTASQENYFLPYRWHISLACFAFSWILVGIDWWLLPGVQRSRHNKSVGVAVDPKILHHAEGKLGLVKLGLVKMGRARTRPDDCSGDLSARAISAIISKRLLVTPLVQQRRVTGGRRR